MNGRSITRLGALRRYDPQLWALEVLAVMRECGGNRRHAAASIGVSWRTLCRWLEDPLLSGAVRMPAGRPKLPKEKS
jgi:hypothetical protein